MPSSPEASSRAMRVASIRLDARRSKRGIGGGELRRLLGDLPHGRIVGELQGDHLRERLHDEPDVLTEVDASAAGATERPGDLAARVRDRHGDIW
jgi:hypothetical protein